MTSDNGSQAHYVPRASALSRAAFAEKIDLDYVGIFNGSHAMCYLNLIHAKHYIRIRGIEEGDRMFHAVLERLNRLAYHGLVGRYEGHTLVLVVSIDQIATLPDFVNSLLPTFGEDEGLAAKIGYVVCKSPLSVYESMQRAKFACESIQHVSGVYLQAFTDKVEEAYLKRSYVVDHLDEAIANGEIQAWAQPIIRILTGRVCEVETLARWQSERYGFLRPDEFIGVLEQHRIIHKLDLEVFRLGCAQWSEARQQGIDVPFGINLSRLDFELCDIYTEICSIMARYQVPVDRVHIEVTESILARNNDTVTEGVQRFRKAGFELYMDDFGSGYSSLGQLARLDFDVVKIDKSMIDDIDHDERARAVLADTVTMVKRLGMQTLCEGVETKDQLEFLQAVGCEKAQGFYISKPTPHDKTMAALEQQARTFEDLEDNDYYDAIGQINLIEGTSADVHGIEAATFLGRLPVAVLEFGETDIKLLTSNYAYMELLRRMGFDSFESFMEFTLHEDIKVNRRALHAAKRARDTGREQVFDFIVGGVYCSTTIRLVAKTPRHEAYLTMVTSMENAPQVTERTLLAGLLDTSGLNFFWKDTQQRFLGANRRFLEYYGIADIENILGKTDEEINWSEQEDPLLKEEPQVLEGKSISDVVAVCQCKGELRDIVAARQPLYSNGAVVGLVGFFADIGPHKADK